MKIPKYLCLYKLAEVSDNYIMLNTCFCYNLSLKISIFHRADVFFALEYSLTHLLRKQISSFLHENGKTSL